MTNLWQENLIYNIIWLRRQSGLSKKTMARLLHIGVPTLDRIEAGQLPDHLQADILVHLADLFRVPIATLLEQKLGGDTLTSAENLLK